MVLVLRCLAPSDVLHVLHQWRPYRRRSGTRNSYSEELFARRCGSKAPARVYATAVEMIGNAEKAAKWLGTPNRALGGEIPIDQLDTDLGTKEVENILGRIAYGVYS